MIVPLDGVFFGLLLFAVMKFSEEEKEEAEVEVLTKTKWTVANEQCVRVLNCVLERARARTHTYTHHVCDFFCFGFCCMCASV